MVIIMGGKIKNILSNALKELERFIGKSGMSEELKPIRVPTGDKGTIPSKGRNFRLNSG